MTFRPLHDRVLVRRLEAPEKTAGGIIIPDNAKEKPQIAENAGHDGAVVAGLLITTEAAIADLGADKEISAGPGGGMGF